MAADVVVDLNAVLASSDSKCIQAPLQWLDSHHESRVRTLIPAEDGYAYAPREVGMDERSLPVRLPAVSLHRFDNAIISTQSSSVFLSDRLLVERVEGVEPARCDFATGQILAHDTTHAQIGIQGAVIDIPRGIFLGGNGSFNYYHFLVEILPRLQHVLSDPNFAHYPLLVDACVEQVPNYRQLIELASGCRPFLALRGNRAYRVGSLVYVTAPNQAPFNLRPDVAFELGYTLTRPSSIAFLRERFTKLAAKDARLPKKIFLARRPGTRNYNQDEVSAIFAEHGFVSVHMEDFSVADQVQLMSNVEQVAGASGAAWANLAFMREGARALCWMPDRYANCAVYSNLAKASGVELRYLYYPAGVNSSRILHRLDYHMEPTKVRQAIKQLWGHGQALMTGSSDTG
jgi:capsular polysaccharide biosynthesis protein